MGCWNSCVARLRVRRILIMNERQKIAFDNPCVVPEQCVDPRFKRIGRDAKLVVSSILTFNFGME